MTTSAIPDSPVRVDNDLGNVLSSLGIGTETLREPLRLTAFEHWVGHIPFAFWLIRTLRPRTLVELGTHRGNSYLAFCQAIEAEGCGTRAYAFDTWEGDVHMQREESLFAELSAYHDPRYGHFSSLVPNTFAEASKLFSEGSIDLLHIDGTHTYDAAREDFLTWRPHLSDQSVVLFHDTNVRRSQYGVWKLWQELSQDYPHFEFYHSFGLGVLCTGSKLPIALDRLFGFGPTSDRATLVRSYFSTRGDASIKRLLGDLRNETSLGEAARQATVIAQLNVAVSAAQHETSSISDECCRLQQDIAGRIAHVAELERHITERQEKATEQSALSAFLTHTVSDLRATLAESQNALVQCQIASAEAERQNQLALTDAENQSRQYKTASQLKLLEAEAGARLARECLESTRALLHDVEDRLSALTSMTARALAGRDKRLDLLQALSDSAALSGEHQRQTNDMLRSIVVSQQEYLTAVSASGQPTPRLRSMVRNSLAARSARLRMALAGAPPASDPGAPRPTDRMPIGFFDREYYLAANPDVAASGEDPEMHFALAGWKEGRWPNPAFDPTFYISQNADVAQAGTNPLVHYAEFGLKEGRETIEPILSIEEDLGTLPSFEDLSDDTRELVREIHETGMFDAAYYLASNPDVAKTGEDPVIHFARIGSDEGRRPNAHFDPLFYAAQNPDLTVFDMNPLVHYALHGLAEGRQTFAMGTFNDGAQAALARKLIEAEYLSSLKQRDESQRKVTRWPIEMPDLFHLRSFQPTHRIAVVIHVYYPDLWAEMKEAISRLSEPFDLFVSLVKGKSDHLKNNISKQYKNAQIFVFPNRGRDILSFLTLASCGVLNRYEVVCKLHTKKSPHREDGHAWRQNLISMILPENGGVADIIAAFDADPDLGLVVADGELNQQGYAWLSNVDQLTELMPAMGRKLSDVVKLPFAGGSIFWIRPFILNDLVGLKIAPEQFECEPIGTDGTIAHAIERLFSTACYSAGMRISVSSEILAACRSHEATPPGIDDLASTKRVVAFYLPQFHPIPENDRWWGRGFTEWTNVTKAEPLFPDHRQPRLPGELGFTDLRVAETRSAQADLAREYGISAFCYYFYWFGEGKLLLDRPLKEVLKTGEPDFPFMICWANEPWSRNWDGADKEVLVPQNYDEGWVEAFAQEIAPILKDPRYLHLDGASGRPIVAIYRIMHLPDPIGSVEALRTALRNLQVGDIHLTAAWLNFGDDERMPDSPQDLGLDSYFDFPPHHLHLSIPDEPDRTALVADEIKPKGMHGSLYDYATVVDLELAEAGKDAAQAERHRGVMMGWDNTARRGPAANVFRGATPGHFRRWLRGIVREETTRAPGSDERLIFVNAWNEWAEGTCLEPDRDFGRGWLEGVQSALGRPNKRGETS